MNQLAALAQRDQLLQRWLSFMTDTPLVVLPTLADMPPGLYVAMAGGVVFSLLVGVGLMGLVFYSSRHGYDDEANRFR